MTEPTLEGRFHGKTHSVWIRVYYADTDAGGVVYHAKYLAFAEQARTETMRAIGLDQLPPRQSRFARLRGGHDARPRRQRGRTD